MISKFDLELAALRESDTIKIATNARMDSIRVFVAMHQFTLINSTSNITTELGGICSPAPWSPQPSSDGI